MTGHIQLSRRLGKHEVKPQGLSIASLYRMSPLDNSLAKTYFFYSEETKEMDT
jgi:hypothetical protein